jgi:hypothetical protein
MVLIEEANSQDSESVTCLTIPVWACTCVARQVPGLLLLIAPWASWTFSWTAPWYGNNGYPIRYAHVTNRYMPEIVMPPSVVYLPRVVAMKLPTSLSLKLHLLDGAGGSWYGCW